MKISCYEHVNTPLTHRLSERRRALTKHHKPFHKHRSLKQINGCNKTTENVLNVLYVQIRQTHPNAVGMLSAPRQLASTTLHQMVQYTFHEKKIKTTELHPGTQSILRFMRKRLNLTKLRKCCSITASVHFVKLL